MLIQQQTLFDPAAIAAAPPAPDPTVTIYLSVIISPGGLCQMTLDADAPLRPADDTCHWRELPQRLPRFVEQVLPSEYWEVLVEKARPVPDHWRHCSKDS